MINYNVAIVDDDISFIEVMKNNISEYSKNNACVFNVSTFTSAVMFLENYKAVYDIVFLDIELEDGNGIDVARKVRRNDNVTMLFFVTNLPQYAIKGYEVNAFDYVIKPINYFSFSVKLNKALGMLGKRKGVPIKVKCEECVKLIESSDIMYIDVMGHDVIFHTVNGNITSYGNLSEREKQLEKYNFARCSACALVNMRYITGLYGDDIQIKNDMVRISRGKKKEFMKRLNEYLGEE